MNYKVIKGLLILSSLCLFFIGLIFSNSYVLLSSVLLILIQNLFYACEKFYERIIFLVFNITLTVFLMGRMFVKTFFNYKEEDTTLFSLNFTDISIVNHILISLYLSYLFIYFGFSLIQLITKNKKGKLINSTKSNYWHYVKVFSKYFFYFTFVFRILYINDIASFVNSYGYYEFYISYASRLPTVFILISYFYDIAFFAFLAMKPNRKEALIPLLIYLFEGGLSLSTGQRSDFILNILIVFVYLCLRNLENNERWFGKKEVLIGGISLPFVFLLMTTLGNLRSRSGEGANTFLESILDFFYTQGVSANVIGYTKYFENSIPDGKFYIFGSFIEFFNANILSKFMDIPVFVGQTIERALYGNSFPHTISYLIMPEVYVTGSGYGSSFIAEFYVDFGYIGVMIGSFCYGILIFMLYKGYRSHPISVIFVLLMTRNLFFTPRAEALSFFTSAFSRDNIFGLIFILIGAYLLKSIVYQKYHKSILTDKG